MLLSNGTASPWTQDLLLRSALWYGRHDIAVTALYGLTNGACDCGNPACVPEQGGSPGKHPRLKDFLKLATTDIEQIRRWWTWWPNSNIGLITGFLFDALDIDYRHGGHATLAALEREHGHLPPTVRQWTGNGYHLLFEPVPGLKSGTDVLGRGIDLRAEGGFIVGARSRHYSGKEYTWDADASIVEFSSAPFPAWVLDKLMAGKAGAATSPEGWRERMATIYEAGYRGQALARLVGRQLRLGEDPYVVLELARAWNIAHCNPPLDPAEVNKILDRICTLEIARRENLHGR
jgi:hypothetical protein